MTPADLKTNYTTQELMNLLPKNIYWESIADGYSDKEYSLNINYNNMSVSYVDFTSNETCLMWRKIKSYAVEDLNNALYLLLVDLINFGWTEDYNIHL